MQKRIEVCQGSEDLGLGRVDSKVGGHQAEGRLIRSWRLETQAFGVIRAQGVIGQIVERLNI